MAPREVMRLKVASLTSDATNPRTHFQDETQLALARSIAERGQLVPILVRMDGGRPVILDGNRRFRAFHTLGLDEIDAIVLSGPLGPGEVLLNQLALGIHHDNLGPIDLARGIDRLQQEGMSRAKVAKQLAISEPTISRKLQLLQLSPGLQERLQRGELTESAARRIVEATVDHAKQDELAARPSKGAQSGVGHSGQAALAQGGTQATRLVACLGKARTITLAGPGLSSLDVAVEWLEELLAHAKKARSKRIGVDTFARLLRDQTETGAPASKEGA